MLHHAMSRFHRMIESHRAAQSSASRRGFTIVEVLIALALSLLLMLSLTQAFKYLSDRIRENRTRVELSTRLRGVTGALQDDIRRITVPLEPQTSASASEGYFVYYEGPLTDASSIVLGGQPNAAGVVNYFRDSRFGDIDDYLAFTAFNPDQPFRGLVPKYLLLERADETDGDANGDGNQNDYDIHSLSAAQMADAIQPVMITSNYAEIIYWLQPGYETIAAPDGLGGTDLAFRVDPVSGLPELSTISTPLYPERVVLHRRVLLIRPDLNIEGTAASPGADMVAGTLPQLPYTVGGGSIYRFMQPDPWPNENGSGPLPQIIRTGGPTGDQRPRAWQIGMTPVHQQCDLSVRWFLDAEGMPLGFNSSDTPRVAANSLKDLTLPHNRFAHVRAPNTVIDYQNPQYARGFTSMPLLAVGSQMPVITDSGALTPDGNGNTTTTTVFAPSFNGFLRPEFALGMDYTHTEVPGPFWGRERSGEDVLNSELLGFDVQGFDRLTPLVYWPGPDGEPGVAGSDDDGNGTNDNPGEYGSPNSDDIVVTSSDPIFFQVSRSDSATGPMASRGDFADLAFERLTGGTVRGFTSLKPSVSSNTAASVSPSQQATLFNTQLSAFRGLDGNLHSLPTSLLKSGKVVLNGVNRPVVFQPTYDTFTTGYEKDGFRQGNVTDSGPRRGTVWWLPDSSFQIVTDRGSNGMDDNAAAALGIDDSSELESAPPFEAPLSSFRVRIRLQDRESGTVVQRNVTGDRSP